MLDIHNQEYFDQVVEFAKRTNQYDQLKQKLDYLETYAEHGEVGKTRCILFRDFAPFSFEFQMQLRQPDGSYKRWFNGGLIYHGAHDGHGSGGAPTFAVTLTPTTGWSIHT
jgi:hypothetical protein